MDRTPVPTKSLGRRQPLAILISLAVAVLGGAAIGFATAAPGDTFQVPAPMGGDEALYEVDSPGSTWDDQQAHIQVQAPAPLMLPDGSWVSASRMRAGADASKFTFSSMDYVMVGWRSAFVDTATGHVVATTTGGSAGSSGGVDGAIVPQLGGSTQSQQSTTTTVEFGAGPVPCGVRTPLQERAVAVGEVLRLDGCDLGEPASFKVVGTRTLDGAPALLLANQRLGSQLWYRSGMPYPVRFDLGVGHPGEEHWTLSGFVRGDQPLVPGPLPPAVQPAPVVTAAADRLGPAHDGLQLPFPIEQAVSRAADLSQEVADFQAAHPDWFLRAAQYEETEQDGAVRGTWFLRMRGDGQELWADVAQQDDQASPVPSEAVRLVGDLEHRSGLEATSSDVHVWDEMFDPDEPAWPASCRPASLATVGSVVDRWSQMEQRPAAQANAYAFDLWCLQGGTHASLTSQVRAGDARILLPPSSTAGPLDPPQSQTTSQVLQMVAVNEDGELTLETTEAAASRSSWGALQHPPSQDKATPVERAGTGPWSPPTGPVAASITVVSVLAGLLYWLWPTIKAGPLALFSRLQAPELLEHPVRKELMQRIEAQPGVHYQDLVRALGKGKGAVEHHLRKLQAGGLVKALAAGGYTCWFPTAYDHRLVGAAPALKSDGARAVLAAVQAHPGRSARDVGVATGLSPAAVNHHLQRLSQAGLVSVVRAGRSLSIMPTDLAGRLGPGTAAAGGAA